ncbi:MAG: hypothetical protein EOP85_16910 [Verrucomicrobiaceae bacterium]|nr:MAG: hypothetical protein EOP85_16910 [Verrucomicrobiaceae bacterium]
MAESLQGERRCVLTLSRSSSGRVKLELRTHTLGKIDIELPQGGVEISCLDSPRCWLQSPG